MAPYTAPFMKTPLFILNSLADAWQLGNIVRLPCIHAGHTVNCSAAELAALRNFRTVELALVQPVLNQPGVGAFLDTCIIHGEENHDARWVNQTVGGQKLRDTIWFWVTGEGRAGLKPQVVDGVYPCNTHCQF